MDYVHLNRFQFLSIAFFQVNQILTKDLYDKILEIVKERKPKECLDFYCGTGSIGIYIADYCKKITGVDYNPSNIKDAKENAKTNQCNHISFICNKVENVIDQFKNIDMIIVDPPRSGLDEKARKEIINISPKAIIYISCNPDTLIRDLKELKEHYIIQEITPFNIDINAALSPLKKYISIIKRIDEIIKTLSSIII